MKFFATCATLEELRKVYRRLAVQYHPDLGGDTETMKQINAERELPTSPSISIGGQNGQNGRAKKIFQKSFL